jgi:DNA-binding Lrp family transcriptional regulator
MDRLLELLRANGRATVEELAQLLGEPPEAVRERIAAYEKDGAIMGYQAVINPELTAAEEVRAIIELRVRPEQDGGFDRLAMRVARFPQVEAAYLVSGAYDLLLLVKGRSLQEVARFVSSRLASLDGVRSTTTCFLLKTYKDQGVLMEQRSGDERLPVSP